MPLIGDPDIDGDIDIIDAFSTAQYFVGLDSQGFDAPVADVNLDNKVDILDALLIAQYYVGLVSELPEQMPGSYIRKYRDIPNKPLQHTTSLNSSF